MQDIKLYAFSDEASTGLEKQIAALKRNGLDGMEIRNIDSVNVADITVEKANRLRARLSDEGLCVWSVGSPIGKIDINEDFEKELDKFRHTLEVALILNANNIRLFSFYIPQNHPAELYMNEVINRLGLFAELANDAGVTLCHENEKGIFGDIPERCLEIHKHLPEIKAVFDPANFVQCRVDTLKAWSILKKHVKYIHIKDALANGSVVPSGEGIGNVEQIVKEFISLGGKHFTIEPHLTLFDGSDKLERNGMLNYKYTYASNEIAFDIACESFKNLLKG